MKKIFISSKQHILILLIFYILIAVTASLFQYYKPLEGGYTKYNNYLIFKNAYKHLVDNQDLYQRYPQAHWDLYKYSPTFALGMMPFYYLPDIVGICLWNLLNALILFVAILFLPIQDKKKNIFILWFILQELLTSMQNTQSNALIAGFLIATFNCFERKNVFWAAFFIIAGFYVKILGLVGGILFLFYPQKFKFIAYCVLWSVILLVFPLVVISSEQLFFLYKNWLHLLTNDHQIAWGLSVMGWLYTWFGLIISKNLVLLVGLIGFLIPLLWIRNYQDKLFRMLFLVSLLIWLVIFNHMAESPSFIIAIAGVGIWYFTQKSNYINTSLIVLAFVFTCLSMTDIFPSFVRENFIKPYVIKAVPCIFIWLRIMYTLIRYRPTSQL